MKGKGGYGYGQERWERHGSFNWVVPENLAICP